MVNKCSVYKCYTNHAGHQSGIVFGLKSVKNVDQKNKWLQFCKRPELTAENSVFICEKHFEEKYIRRNKSISRLIRKLNPIPTIQPVGVYDEKPSCIPKIETSRKPPTKRVFQQDELSKFQSNFKINTFDDIDESLLKLMDRDYRCSRYENHTVFYKFVTDVLSIPQITECIRINCDLTVKLFFKGSPIPLPDWFRKGTHCRLTSKDMLPNLSSYIRQESNNRGEVFEEINRIRFQKHPIYSASLLRYALELRYSSLQAYQLMLNEFRLPSVKLLNKITLGKIDTSKALTMLKENKSISEDVILIYDEMFLQKCEEYVGGECIGADIEGDLYRGVVNFMIVALKSSVPYVIKTIPEKTIVGDWIRTEILDCLVMLQEKKFNVRGVVCDDHSTNVNGYKKLLEQFGQQQDDLSITLNGMKVYLFHDTVHLMKKIRNNLLNRKRFLFPSFQFDGFTDPVKVTGGEISWHLLHQVHDKDRQMEANLKTAPKLTSTVLHPGNCKQSVPVALAIFHETTSAAIQFHFPDKIDASEFLKLFNTWWIISNAKEKIYSRNRIGNAAICNDRKPEFLLALADWIEKWGNESIQNFEKFCLTAQTRDALIRTLKCHAALIDELLRDDGYKFVLTARFQSDPIERRFGQYRQMSGGRFLVSLKDVSISEKILKIKSLIKEGFDIDSNVKVEANSESELEIFDKKIPEILYNINRSSLTENSRSVSDYIAGFIVHKVHKPGHSCCNERLFDSKQAGDSYHNIISRGGLVNASIALKDYVSKCFYSLDACQKSVRESKVPERQLGEYLLQKVMSNNEFGFSCPTHEDAMCSKINRIICNVFFNNQRKRSNESVVDDRVRNFKKVKYSKR